MFAREKRGVSHNEKQWRDYAQCRRPFQNLVYIVQYKKIYIGSTAVLVNGGHVLHDMLPPVKATF